MPLSPDLSGVWARLLPRPRPRGLRVPWPHRPAGAEDPWTGPVGSHGPVFPGPPRAGRPHPHLASPACGAIGTGGTRLTTRPWGCRCRGEGVARVRSPSGLSPPSRPCSEGRAQARPPLSSDAPASAVPAMPAPPGRGGRRGRLPSLHTNSVAPGDRAGWLHPSPPVSSGTPCHPLRGEGTCSPCWWHRPGPLGGSPGRGPARRPQAAPKALCTSESPGGKSVHPSRDHWLREPVRPTSRPFLVIGRSWSSMGSSEGAAGLPATAARTRTRSRGH